MDDETLKKFAALRLAANGRVCDGCGEPILRFTSKCFYDAKNDQAYCSLGGCADGPRNQPPCISCKARMNPLRDKIHPVPGVGDMCDTCVRDAGKDSSKRKGLNILDHEEVQGLTEVEKKWVGEGPYVVVKTARGILQLVLPVEGKKHVRATGEVSGILRMMQKCAKVNQAA